MYEGIYRFLQNTSAENATKSLPMLLKKKIAKAWYKRHHYYIRRRI